MTFVYTLPQVDYKMMIDCSNLCKNDEYFLTNSLSSWSSPLQQSTSHPSLTTSASELSTSITSSAAHSMIASLTESLASADHHPLRGSWQSNEAVGKHQRHLWQTATAFPTVTAESWTGARVIALPSLSNSGRLMAHFSEGLAAC